MTIWKVELGPVGPRQLRYRAVVEADTADGAVATARKRFPLAAKGGAAFQAFDKFELADQEGATEFFLARGLMGFYDGRRDQ